MKTTAIASTLPRPAWLLTIMAALLLSAAVLGACENTYKGVGRDMDEMSDEMEDGWN